MRRILLGCAVAAGAILIAAGAAFIYPPAGLIVLGAETAAAGLLVDDGTAA